LLHRRKLKRLNVLLAFLSVNSELLSVIFATNAINRLYFLDHDTLMSHNVMVRILPPRAQDAHPPLGLFRCPCQELLKHESMWQFWLAVYIHFVLGVVGHRHEAQTPRAAANGPDPASGISVAGWWACPASERTLPWALSSGRRSCF